MADNNLKKFFGVADYDCCQIFDIQTGDFKISEKNSKNLGNTEENHHIGTK